MLACHNLQFSFQSFLPEVYSRVGKITKSRDAQLFKSTRCTSYNTLGSKLWSGSIMQPYAHQKFKKNHRYSQDATELVKRSINFSTCSSASNNTMLYLMSLWHQEEKSCIKRRLCSTFQHNQNIVKKFHFFQTMK